MGLFNNADKEEKRIKRTIEANDFYKGIKCSIQKDTPPFDKLTIFEFNKSNNDEDLISKSDDVSESIYCLKSNNFDTIIQAASDGIIIEDATKDIEDIVIPFTNIIKSREGELPKELIIELINNQKIVCSVGHINEDSLYGPKYLRDYMMSIINNYCLGNQFDETETITKAAPKKDQIKNEPINKTQEYINNLGAPREWAKEEVKKVEDELEPILGKEGIFKLIRTLEKIAIDEGYEAALGYLEYTRHRVDYYNNKKKDYIIESKLADNIYKSYVTDGISRLEKVNGRFMALQNMKLDILIEQNTKIIQLLEEIAKK